MNRMYFFALSHLLICALSLRLSIKNVLHSKVSQKGFSFVNTNYNICFHGCTKSVLHLSTPSNENQNTSTPTDYGNVIQSNIFQYFANISWPNLLSGVALGSLITVSSIFGPFIYELYHSNDYLILQNDNSINLPVNSNSVPYNKVASTSSQLNVKNEKDMINAISKSVDLFETILIQLKNGYVDNINPNQLFETGISAMLKSLDPYTEYENLKDATEMREAVSGKYGGVGMIISGVQDQTKLKLEQLKSLPLSKDPNSNIIFDETDKTKFEENDVLLKQLEKKGIVVVDAFEGYAYNNNIRVGDRILSIDGTDVTDMTVDKVRNLLRGDPGTDITITLERETFPVTNSKTNTRTNSMTSNDRNEKSIVTVNMKRQQVKISDVSLATFLGPPQDGIGYIALNGFNADVAKDFASAFLMLKYSAPFGLQGLILDLRGNPGGLLDAAVDITSYLVPSNSPIVSAKAKNEPEVVFRSSYEPLRSKDMKLAVLVNSGSASASEIVSGAIQDLDMGVIVGDGRTYGKGLVQKIIPLPYDSSLKYTVAKYYTPSGRCIQAVNYLGGRSDLQSPTASSPTTVPIDNGSTNKNDQRKAQPVGTIVNPTVEDIAKVQSITNTNIAAASTNDLDMNKDEQNYWQRESAMSGDGATIVPNNQRKSFNTINGRLVLDGGGITPDVKVDGFKLSPIETILVQQNMYAEFVSQFMHKYNIRPILSIIPNNEVASKENDPRYDFKVAQSIISKFFVLPTNYLFNNDDDSHVSDPVKSSISDVSLRKSKDNMIIESNGNSISQTQQSETNQLLSRLLSSTMSPLALPLTNPIHETSIVPQLSSSTNNKNNQISSKSALNVNSWENDLMSLQKMKSSIHLTDNDIYQEFKTFINQKYKSGKLKIDFEDSTAKINALKKEFRDKGFEDLAKELESLNNDLNKNILNDMDNDKQFIYDTIELTMLGRELPDRLLLYRAVNSDPQVEIARNVLTGGKKTKENKYQTNNKNIKKIVSVSNANIKNIVTTSGVVNKLNFQDADKNTINSNDSPNIDPTSRIINGESVDNFTGLYERILNPLPSSN